MFACTTRPASSNSTSCTSVPRGAFGHADAATGPGPKSTGSLDPSPSASSRSIASQRTHTSTSATALATLLEYGLSDGGRRPALAAARRFARQFVPAHIDTGKGACRNVSCVSRRREKYAAE